MLRSTRRMYLRFLAWFHFAFGCWQGKIAEQQQQQQQQNGKKKQVSFLSLSYSALPLLSRSLLAHFPFGSEKLHAAVPSTDDDDDYDDDDDVDVDEDGKQARQVFSFSFCCC